MNDVIILLLIGFAAGIASGILGVGGGIVVIPALVLIMGYSQKLAQGTSLGLLLMPIGILAVMNYYKAGYLDIKAALIMSITFLAGSYLSSYIAVNLHEHIIKKIFAVFMFAYAIKLFMDK